MKLKTNVSPSNGFTTQQEISFQLNSNSLMLVTIKYLLILETDNIPGNYKGGQGNYKGGHIL